MKSVVIRCIKLYQIIISPLLKQLLGVKRFCRYPISCSEYTKEEIEKNGVIRGIQRGFLRFLNCQPFGTIGKR